MSVSSFSLYIAFSCIISYKSGWILATICNLCITIPLGISLLLVLETMARGSAVLASEESKRNTEDGDDSLLIKKNISQSTSPTHHRFANGVNGDIAMYHSCRNSDLEDTHKLLIVGETKIELADLTEMFMGLKGKYSFVAFVRYF